jgi:hypothetical protein
MNYSPPYKAQQSLRWDIRTLRVLPPHTRALDVMNA